MKVVTYLNYLSCMCFYHLTYLLSFLTLPNSCSYSICASVTLLNSPFTIVLLLSDLTFIAQCVSIPLLNFLFTTCFFYFTKHSLLSALLSPYQTFFVLCATFNLLNSLCCCACITLKVSHFTMCFYHLTYLSVCFYYLVKLSFDVCVTIVLLNLVCSMCYIVLNSLCSD